MNVRIHADRIAGTSLHAVTAVDATQGIDLVPCGILFDLRIRALRSLDVNAVRRTRRCTEEARGAAHRSVFLERETMAAAIVIAVALALFRVLHGHHRTAALQQPELMSDVEKEVPPEPVTSNDEPAEDFR